MGDKYSTKSCGDCYPTSGPLATIDYLPESSGGSAIKYGDTETKYQKRAYFTGKVLMD
jgi:hypothetical protein